MDKAVFIRRVADRLIYLQKRIPTTIAISISDWSEGLKITARWQEKNGINMCQEWQLPNKPNKT